MEAEAVLFLRKRKRKRENFTAFTEKDKPYLTKMMTPPLASATSVEKTPDREWVPSDRKAKNPGIRKEEDKLRLIPGYK